MAIPWEVYKVFINYFSTLKKNYFCMYIFYKGIFSVNKLNPRTRFSKSKNPAFSIQSGENELHAFVLRTMVGDLYITKHVTSSSF